MQITGEPGTQENKYRLLTIFSKYPRRGGLERSNASVYDPRIRVRIPLALTKTLFFTLMPRSSPVKSKSPNPTPFLNLEQASRNNATEACRSDCNVQVTLTGLYDLPLTIFPKTLASLLLESQKKETKLKIAYSG